MADITEDEREEELSSLQAIYPELQIDRNNPFAASIDLLVAPNTPLSVAFPPPVNGAPPVQSFAQAVAADSTVPKYDTQTLSYLPSLHLDITLPEGYPSEQPPTLKLSTTPAWLPQSTLESLEKEGPSLWEEYGHMQVLFSYISYLQEASERGFDIAEGKLEVPQDMKIMLLDFDIKSKREKFERETFDCGVCLEPKKGSSCYRLQRCGHVFCIACLQDFYNNAISEGDVNTVRCLSPDCGKGARNSPGRKKKRERLLTPSELLQIPIERSQVVRYVELKRKKKLESDKTTIYCPRTWCQGAARSKKYPKITDLSQIVESESEEEDDRPPEQKPSAGQKNTDRLAICEDCNYAFCRVCLAGWHGEFVRCWPREASELTQEEQASINYILAHTSPCPTCSVPCQKTHGCNHMRCFQCKTHFCYLCGSWLEPNNPYEHFNNPNKQCYMRLWELEEGDNGNGNAHFDGIRGAEAAAQRAEQEAMRLQQEEVEAAEQEVAQARAAGVEVEIIEVDLAQLGLGDGQPPPPAPDPPALPRQAARPPQNAGVAAQRRRDNVPRAPQAIGPQRAAHGGGGRPARLEVNQMGLQHFLQMVQDDREDEWDSDELDEDDEEFRIPERV